MKTFPVLVLLGITLLFMVDVSAELSKSEKERRALNAQYDKRNIRGRAGWIVDTSPSFILSPPHIDVATGYTNAETPPEVRMRILPGLDPEYFPEGPAYMTGWSVWNHMTRSEDNRFFFSASDHRGFGCNINLYEYNRGRDVLHKVLDVDEVLGWTANSYTDGKIHGHMGIMPDGTLWAATHFGVRPDSAWFANGYRGSWLLSYNIYTHEAKNWGVPLVGQNLPSFSIDTERGRMVGSGSLNDTMLCWDCINKTARFAGNLPNGWKWWQRSQLLDEATGVFWSIDFNDKRYPFMSYDPELNAFERYDVYSPENPYSGHVGSLRAHTERPAEDGFYYWCTMSGLMFRFKPSYDGTGPYVEPVGVNWDEGRDVLQFAMDPSGRYIYYLPVGHNHDDVTPVVQYDVRTRKIKALCWLRDHYFDTYGYWTTGTFALNITRDGSALVLCMNGAFEGADGSRYGHPSLYIIEIPESER